LPIRSLHKNREIHVSGFSASFEGKLTDFSSASRLAAFHDFSHCVLFVARLCFVPLCLSPLSLLLFWFNQSKRKDREILLFVGAAGEQKTEKPGERSERRTQQWEARQNKRL
jgi:hypothetical protein